jgi:hypothetical protein
MLEQLLIEIPRNLKRKLKSHASELGVTMKDFVVYAIRQQFTEFHKGTLTKEKIEGKEKKNVGK